MSIPQIPSRYGKATFIVAGSLMMVQVIFIGLHRYGFASITELWAAPPGIASIVASIVGLVTLYPRITNQAPKLAIAGVNAALVAGGALFAAASWLIGSVVLDGSIQQPLPKWFLAAIAVFMIAYVLGFGLTAAASLCIKNLRHVGYLLLVPVISWTIILGVAIASNLTDALKLDLYTNLVIALTFITIGMLLENGRSRA